MFQLITTLLAGAAQTSAVANLQVANLPEIFVATCLDGQARVAASDVTKIGFDNLPSKLRRQLGRPTTGDVWRLNTSGHAFLYVLTYAPQAGVNPKICGLASDEMNLSAAADLLDLRLAGSVYPTRLRATQWMRPEDGYVATATTAGKYSVAQINWLSDEDRKAAIEDLRPVSR
jgi:hypothetical protein